MNRRFLVLAALAVGVFGVIAFLMWYFAWRPARYVDAARGFSIRFSAEWEVAGEGEGAHMRALRILGAAQGGGTGVISVVMNSIVNIPDADAYRSWYTEHVTRRFKDYERIRDGTRTLEGADVPWTLFTYRSDEGRRAQVWQFFFVRGSRGYVVTCTATPMEFERFRRDFEEAVDSFKIE